jgi:hypothetical protein
MKVVPKDIVISISNEEKLCFICRDNDGDIQDFPCKNCKLYIHKKCFKNYKKKFNNYKTCSVCKKDITIKNNTQSKPNIINPYFNNISSNQCACILFSISLLLYLGNQFLEFLNIKLI